MVDLAELIKAKMEKAAKGGKASIVVAEDDGASEALSEAASDMIDAIKAEDSEALASALRGAVDIICADHDGEHEDSEDEI